MPLVRTKRSYYDARIKTPKTPFKENPLGVIVLGVKTGFHTILQNRIVPIVIQFGLSSKIPYMKKTFVIAVESFKQQQWKNLSAILVMLNLKNMGSLILFGF